MSKLFILFILVCFSNASVVGELQESFKRNVVMNTNNKDNNKITQLSTKNILNIQKEVNKLLKKGNIKSDEFFSIVDLEKQLFIIVLYVYKEKKIHVIGSQEISSGDMYKEEIIKYGEHHYFDTPLGVFNVKDAWRSDGEYKDDNVTQAYGTKNNFVYYIGKMEAVRLNSFDKRGKKLKSIKDYKLIKDTLNFAIHSYNSSDKMGVKNSHGCVRLSDELNVFLEENLVLHKNFFKNNKWNLKYSFKPKKIVNQNIKGSYLIIVKKL